MIPSVGFGAGKYMDIKESGGTSQDSAGQNRQGPLEAPDGVQAEDIEILEYLEMLEEMDLLTDMDLYQEMDTPLDEGEKNRENDP